MRRFLQILVATCFIAGGLSAQTIADFETQAAGTAGFSDNGWGAGFTSVEWQSDPAGASTGALALVGDASLGEKGVIEKQNIDPMDADMILVDVYLPADFPDDGQISLWGQDAVNWTGWNASEYPGSSIDKETWVTLEFNMRQISEADPGTFNPYDGNMLGKLGVQVFFGSSSDWTGTVYIDNIVLDIPRDQLSWVVNDFEIEELGTAGFTMSYGSAFLDLYWWPDITERTTGTLEFEMDYGLGEKAAIHKDPVDILWTDADTGAIAFSFDVWVPFDFPESAVIKVFTQDRVNWTWNDVKFNLTGAGGTQIIAEEWNTITVDLLSIMQSNPDYDISNGIKVGMEVQYSAQDWDGFILVDNFTLIGVTPPAATLVSPDNVTAMPDTMSGAFDNSQYFNTVAWNDLPENASETYNVYASKSPITDVEADGVMRLATQVPRGAGYFNHQLYSEAGAEQTWYYAVTTRGVDAGQLVETELIEGSSTAGPVVNKSTMPMLIPLDPSFAFNPDGELAEFQQYNFAAIQPAYAGGPAAESWSNDSQDINFTGYLVMDNDNLYVGFHVVDGHPDFGNQAWEGDGMDIFLGLYDVATLDVWHGDGSIYSSDFADYRLSFAVNAALGEQFQKSGSEPWDLSGLNMQINKSETGYVIEAMIPFAPLEPLQGDLFVPQEGMMLPLKIDVNDNDGTDDPYYGGSNRTMTLHAGGVANAENWRRPYAWGQAMITGPTGVSNEPLPSLPNTTALHGNYPNPFNPSTTIQYSLEQTTDVSLVVHDVLGRKVQTLMNQKQRAGQHSHVWNGRDNNGNTVSAGLYFITLKTNHLTLTRKMLLVK